MAPLRFGRSKTADTFVTSPETASTPVIIINGVSHDFKRFIETRRQVHPPEGYFEKPVDRDQLLTKVNEILSAKPV